MTTGKNAAVFIAVRCGRNGNTHFERGEDAMRTGWTEKKNQFDRNGRVRNCVRTRLNAVEQDKNGVELVRNWFELGKDNVELVKN